MLNAEQAMPEGGTLTLIAAARRGNGVRLDVIDTGCGIPAEQLPKLFRPFHTTKTNGHGLGLAIARKIVAAHGGTIDVQSEPGRGTKFTIRLPAGALTHLREPHALIAPRRPRHRRKRRDRPGDRPHPRADHDLILTARRDAELRALAAELAPATCHVLPADLADPAAPRRLVEMINADGLSIDVLVNNAGFGDLGPFAEADLAKMLRMIQVNVTALTELTGLVLPGMLARRPRPHPQRRLGRRLPARPAHGRLLRHQGLREFLLRGALERSGGNGRDGDVPRPRAHRERVRRRRRNGPAHRSAVADARSVAEAGVRGMMRGKRLVVTGTRNKLLLFAERFLPRGMVIRAVRRLQEKRRASL